MIREYYEEIERAKQPGYVSRYDDFDFEYSDAPRSRPARFDQPHAHPAEQPHIGTKGPAMHEKRGAQAAFSQQRRRRRYGDAARARRRRATDSAQESFRSERAAYCELEASSLRASVTAIHALSLSCQFQSLLIAMLIHCARARSILPAHPKSPSRPKVCWFS